jgi:hypothetical protein
MIEEVTVFFPNGKQSYFKLGEKLVGAEGKKTKVSVHEIKFKLNKTLEIKLSNGKSFNYCNLGIAFTKM